MKVHPMTAKLHLLIVDDEEAHIAAICRAFEEAGVRVEIESVGTLQGFREVVQVRKPDLALVDLNLPDGRALEVLTHPPEDAPFPILVMTAFGNQQIVLEVMKAGALDYVVKSPDTFATMPRTVAHALREWALLQRHKRSEIYHEMGREVLQILNEPGDAQEFLGRVVAIIKRRAGVDAVGIRLQAVNDYPYIAQRGLSDEFLRTENTLVERGMNGDVCRDEAGNVKLECTCGLVISGKTVPSSPLFTRAGSFWTNDAFPLLELPTDKDPRYHPRNECIHQGYASVALVPIRDKDRIVGLIHLNDRRKNSFTLEAIELMEGVASHIGVALMRKRVEEALRDSEQLLKDSQVVAGLGSYVLDVRSGIWSHSDLLAVIFGIDAAYQCTVEGWEALIHPDDRTMMANYFRDEVLGRGQMFDKDYRIIRHNDQVERWVHGLGRLETDSQGRPLRMIGTIQDITARKESEETMVRLEGRLQQAQKLEAIGRLAGGVAHDFNNLIMAIMGYAELCRDGLPEEHPNRCYLNEILLASRRSADLTRQLLAFARKQPIAPVVLDLNDAVAGMLKLLRKLIGEDIDLVWMPGAGLFPVKMDPSQLDQILANLCVNARDAIVGVGSVTIKTDVITIDQAFCVNHTGAVPGMYLLISVSDNGCGMEKEVLANIFEPFFTTKDVGKGTGLGLATVYGIVKQNNGFIHVQSEPGKGATFEIYLPQFVGNLVTSADKETGAVPRGRGEMILLVEDEGALREACGLFLGTLGYNVLKAATPAEALGLATEQGGDIRLLLTDVIMPGMNGRELAERILARKPGLPCVFMSGYTANVMADRGSLPEGVSFIQKPFSRDDLARRLRKLLDRS